MAISIVIILNFIFTPLIEIIRGQNFIKRSEYGKLKLNGLQRDHPPAKAISNPNVNLFRFHRWVRRKRIFRSCKVGDFDRKVSGVILTVNEKMSKKWHKRRHIRGPVENAPVQDNGLF